MSVKVDLEEKKLTHLESQDSGPDPKPRSVLSQIREENSEKKLRVDYSGISIAGMNPTLVLSSESQWTVQQFLRLRNTWIMVCFLLISNLSLIMV
jgi:hypothetical protein